MPREATEAKGSIYHGIKRLWKAEVELWTRDLSTASYSLYKIPNSNYNTEEHWVIFSPDDLVTLKKYLKDFNRLNDFDKKQKITK